MNKQRLFTASCIALIATAMSFAIRGDIMGDFESIFQLNKTNVGWIAGAAFWGFGLSIFDRRPAVRRARHGHDHAPGGRRPHRRHAAHHRSRRTSRCCFLATVIIGIANGLVEAAVNPLIATIYDKEKTVKLTALHAWFPGGIVIGGVLAFLFTQVGFGWQAKMLLMLVPSVIYTFLFVGQTFPPTERVAAGVPFGDMFKESAAPAVPRDLGRHDADRGHRARGRAAGMPTSSTRSWRARRRPASCVLVWVNGIMYLMRQFGGNVSHKVSPVALIAVTRDPGRRGPLLLQPRADAGRGLRRGGAARHRHRVLVADDAGHHVGAVPAHRRARAGDHRRAPAASRPPSPGPVMGRLNDMYGPREMLAIWAILPVLLVAIFGAIYLRDKAAGGYRVERIGA